MHAAGMKLDEASQPNLEEIENLVTMSARTPDEFLNRAIELVNVIFKYA